MKRYKVKITPSILTQLYETAVSTGYGIKFGQKIDCADINVPHFGLKWVTEKPANQNGLYDDANYGAITFEVRYNITMFNTR